MFRKAQRLVTVVVAAIAFGFVVTPVTSAFATDHPGSVSLVTRGGSGSGGFSGSSTKIVKAPSGSGSGSGVKAPTGTGNKAPAPTKGKGTTTRTPGSSYTVGGKTYYYSSKAYGQYYSTYGAGFPKYNTDTFWLLWESPYYYPNYVHGDWVNGHWIYSRYYHQQLPAGYVLSNGMLVASASDDGNSHTIMWIVITCVILLFLVVGFVSTVVRNN